MKRYKEYRKINIICKKEFWRYYPSHTLPKKLMKVKTGSKNSKIGTPRIAKVAKPAIEKKEKTPRIAKQEIDPIPTWVRESSETKPKRAE